MFNLNFKIGISDILLVLGIFIITIGIFFIYKPAALIFLGVAFVFLAFTTYTPPKTDKKQ